MLAHVTAKGYGGGVLIAAHAVMDGQHQALPAAETAAAPGTLVSNMPSRLLDT